MGKPTKCVFKKTKQEPDAVVKPWEITLTGTPVEITKKHQIIVTFGNLLALLLNKDGSLEGVVRNDEKITNIPGSYALSRHIGNNFERHHHAVYFGDLEVGEHFIWGGKEHVKLPEVGSGTMGFVSQDQYPGLVNCIQVGTCELSGMGPLVEVYKKPLEEAA